MCGGIEGGCWPSLSSPALSRVRGCLPSTQHCRTRKKVDFFPISLISIGIALLENRDTQRSLPLNKSLIFALIHLVSLLKYYKRITLTNKDRNKIGTSSGNIDRNKTLKILFWYTTTHTSWI